MKRVASLACGLLLAAAYLRVMSWNTLHAGYSGSTDWNAYAAQAWNDFGTTAAAANGADLVFGQEVMYPASAASVAAALTATSGFTWDYRVTAAIGRSSYKESYAVFFRTDRVQLISATVWADTGDKFEREPQIVKVRHIQTGADFTFINWHTVFGTTAERQAEIAADQHGFQFDPERQQQRPGRDPAGRPQPRGDLAMVGQSDGAGAGGEPSRERADFDQHQLCIRQSLRSFLDAEQLRDRVFDLRSRLHRRHVRVPQRSVGSRPGVSLALPPRCNPMAPCALDR
jgi:hypothetical protein